jgi:hypothetical protein
MTAANHQLDHAQSLPDKRYGLWQLFGLYDPGFAPVKALLAVNVYGFYLKEFYSADLIKSPGSTYDQRWWTTTRLEFLLK